MGRTEQIAVPDTRTEALAARFRPIFARIAEGALDRERGRVLPTEPIRWLVEAGFGAIRVPVAHGGDGASLAEVFGLLIELAEADPNIPQALRAHFALVEDRLNIPEAEAAPWFRRVVAGQTFGSAWTEVGNRIGEVGTIVTPLPEGGFRIDGRKYYSTGTIFADWIDTLARRSDTGEDVIALVPTAAEGVERIDDWTGFGQTTTGSGTTVLRSVKLAPDEVVPFSRRFPYQTAYYQLVLNAVQAGIARAILRDAVTQVRARKRIFSHGNAATAAADAQIQQVIGRLSVTAFTVEAATLRAAATTDRAAEASRAGRTEGLHELVVASELDAGKAQAIATELVPRAAGELFNALGASGTDVSLALDRHWRNSRTVACHNPAIYKERIIGDHALNGTEPVYVWQIGTSAG